MQRDTRTRAIVLRRTDYGEADRILQLLTPEGKRSVIARGVAVGNNLEYADEVSLGRSIQDRTPLK